MAPTRRRAALFVVSAATGQSPKIFLILARVIRSRPAAVHGAAILKRKAQDQGARTAAVELDIVGRPAANLAETEAAVERQRRRIALLDFKMHGANALPRQMLQMLGEQRAGKAPPPSLWDQSNAKDLGLVGRPSREDEPIRLAATPDEKAVSQDIAFSQQALEVQGAPCARKGVPM